jgi:hypothetical protein
VRSRRCTTVGAWCGGASVDVATRWYHCELEANPSQWVRPHVDRSARHTHDARRTTQLTPHMAARVGATPFRRRDCTRRVVNFLSRRSIFECIALCLCRSGSGADVEYTIVINMSYSVYSCNRVYEVAPLVMVQCRLGCFISHFSSPSSARHSIHPAPITICLLLRMLTLDDSVFCGLIVSVPLDRCALHSCTHRFRACLIASLHRSTCSCTLPSPTSACHRLRPPSGVRASSHTTEVDIVRNWSRMRGSHTVGRSTEDRVRCSYMIRSITSMMKVAATAINGMGESTLADDAVGGRHHGPAKRMRWCVASRDSRTRI